MSRDGSHCRPAWRRQAERRVPQPLRRYGRRPSPAIRGRLQGYREQVEVMFNDLRTSLSLQKRGQSRRALMLGVYRRSRTQPTLVAYSREVLYEYEGVEWQRVRPDVGGRFCSRLATGHSYREAPTFSRGRNRYLYERIGQAEKKPLPYRWQILP